MGEETKTEEKKENKFSFADGLSLDEAKVSVVAIGFVITLIFTLVMYYQKGDISDNLSEIVIAFILVIGGVNAANRISDFFMKRK